MYFYYKKSFHGQYVPVKSVDKPKAKNAEGQEQKFAQITELDTTEAALSLELLQRIHPLKEGDS